MAQTARAKRKRETTNPIRESRRSPLAARAAVASPRLLPFFCSWPRATEPGILSAGAAAGSRRTSLRASCQISIGISTGRGREEREGKKARAAMATIEQWKEERERSLSCSLSDAACSFSLTGGQEQGRGSSPQRERRAPREEGNQGGGNIPCLFFFERGKRKEKRGGEVKKAKKAGRAPLGRCSLSRRQQKERKKELPSLFLFHRSLSLSTSSVLPSL
jgi:hypothetical protein